MELKDVLAIAGHAGLFKFVAQGRDGIIVESMPGGARCRIPATARVSALGEIAIYTQSEDIPLAEVFQTLFQKLDGQEAPSPKTEPQALKLFFEEVLPQYDRDRVHVSDIKKVVTWYNLLVAAGMTEFKTGHEEQEPDTNQAE